MQQARAFKIDPSALDTLAEPADRLIPVAHFVPYALPSLFADEPHALTPSQVDKLARMIALAQGGGDDRNTGKKRKTGIKPPKRAAKAAKQWHARAGYPEPSQADPLKYAQISPEEQIERLLDTEFGLLFLDRTRIRPAGFALGEHLTTLSLAPGEEVTIEQRTFTKQEKALEETRDNETSREQELSSSYSNELSESLDWQLALSRKSSNSIGGKLGASYEGANVEASTQTATDLTDGDTRTSRQSLKNTENGSRKVAAKQRQQHKIVLKLSQESRFESGSKRVIRNANALAPVDLVYFKVMQRLRITQERHGVRLCWAPTVASPAARFFSDLQNEYLAFMLSLPRPNPGQGPARPNPPASSPAKSVSNSMLATSFDPVWGGQSADYTIDLAAPPGYVWDGQEPRLTLNFTALRSASARLLSFVGTGSGLRAIVHVGIEDCRNPYKPWFWEAQGSASIELTASFLPTPNVAADQAYANQLANYQRELQEWNDRKYAAEREFATDAEARWAARRGEIMAKANVFQEVLGSLIEQAFPRTLRDEPVELDYWERLFDFEQVSIRFYPSWWSGRNLRDPDSGVSSFFNAEWARVYLPIRPEAEREALRWLLGRGGVLPNLLDRMIDDQLDQLRAYRRIHFGGDEELAFGALDAGGCPLFARPYRCLGSWEELIPTDGTHLEVLQATTSAADDQMAASLGAENDLAVQQAALVARDVAIKDIVTTTGLTGLTAHVEIRVPEAKPD